MLDHATIGTRLYRSASQPIGTAPRTKKAEEAVPIKTMAPSLDMERVLDLGRQHEDRRFLELGQRDDGGEHDEHSPPADRQPLPQGHGSALAPGKKGVGETILAGAVLLRLAGGFLLQNSRGQGRGRTLFPARLQLHRPPLAGIVAIRTGECPGKAKRRASSAEREFS